jgi:DNA-binding NtrC family response regulator
MKGEHVLLMQRAILPRAVPYIMVVESDPDIAALLQYVLQREIGKRTIMMKTVADTLRITASLKPLVFLINSKLLDGDGIKLYDLLQQSGSIRDVPTIMMSTYLHDAHKETEERNLLSLHMPTDVDRLSQEMKKRLEEKMAGTESGSTTTFSPCSISCASHHAS